MIVVSFSQAVVIHVVILTECARMLGVEMHVCEVQLMLDAWSFMQVHFQTIAPASYP